VLAITPDKAGCVASLGLNNHITRRIAIMLHALLFLQVQVDFQGGLDSLLYLRSNYTPVGTLQTCLRNGADLVSQNDGILRQIRFPSLEKNFTGIYPATWFQGSKRENCNNWHYLVKAVIADDENRALARLF